MPGRKADHSFPSSAKVKNKWSHTYNLPNFTGTLLIIYYYCYYYYYYNYYYYYC